MDANDIEITIEMLEEVAKAQLFRHDDYTALRKVAGRITNAELEVLYRRVVTHPDFEAVKTDMRKFETLTLPDDNLDTILLMYNDLLKEARFEKKYEVIIRILKELQKLKSISDEETKFEIIIDVRKPEEK